VDVQLVLNLVFSLLGLLGGWMLNRIFTLIDRLDKDVREMPKIYVTKADYQNDIQDIKKMLSRIFDKLDDKADK
jgi:hypothetical protein